MAGGVVLGFILVAQHAPGLLQAYISLLLLLGLISCIWSCRTHSRQQYAALEIELARIRQKLEDER